MPLPCSTYLGFCGNDVSGSGGVRQLVCQRLLSPVTASQRLKLPAWALYGAITAQRWQPAGCTCYIRVSFRHHGACNASRPPVSTVAAFAHRQLCCVQVEVWQSRAAAA